MSRDRSSRVAEADGRDEVDQLAQALFIEGGPGVVLGQDAFQFLVIAFDGDHGVVQELADLGLLGSALEKGPPGLLGHPEDVLGAVLIAVFRVGAVGRLGL